MRVRRVLRIISLALLTAGTVILADVAMTLAWKEPVSTIYSSIEQDAAAGELERLGESFPSAADLRALEKADGVREKAGLLADRFGDDMEQRIGEGIGRVVIPEVDLDVVLVEGTDSAALQRGPGHYPETALPGQGRTVGIAGHRTTYLAPFRHLDQIEEGDEILLEMPYATFTYEAGGSTIVEPSDVQIVGDVGYERVVLTACYPLYSAAQRIAVFGRLSDVRLFVAGERRWLDP